MKKTFRNLLTYFLVVALVILTLPMNEISAAGKAGRNRLVASVSTDVSGRQIKAAKLTYLTLNENGQVSENQVNLTPNVYLKKLSQLGKEFVIELPADSGLRRLGAEAVDVVITNNADDFAVGKSLPHLVKNKNGLKLAIVLENELQDDDSVFLKLVVKERAFADRGRLVVSVNGNGADVKGATVTYNTLRGNRTMQTNGSGVARVANISRFGTKYEVKLPKELKLERLSNEDVSVVVAKDFFAYMSEESLPHSLATVFDPVNGSKVVVTLKNGLVRGDNVYLYVKVKDSALEKRGELMAAVELEEGVRIEGATVSYTANGNAANGKTNSQGRLRVKEVAQFGKEFVVTLPTDLNLERLAKEDVKVLVARGLENFANEVSMAHSVATAFGKEGNKVVVTLQEELKQGDNVYLAVELKKNTTEKRGELMAAVELEGGNRVKDATVSYTANSNAENGKTNSQGRLRVKEVVQFGKEFVVTLPADLNLERLAKEDVKVLVARGLENFANEVSMAHSVATDFGKDGNKVVVTLQEELKQGDSVYLLVELKKSATEKRGELMAAVELEEGVRVEGATVSYTANSNAENGKTNSRGRLRVKEVAQFGKEFVVELPASLNLEGLTEEDVKVLVARSWEDFASETNLAHSVATTFDNEGSKVVITLNEELEEGANPFLFVQVKKSAFETEKPSDLIVAVQSEEHGRVSGAKVTYQANGEEITKETNRTGRLRVREVYSLGNKVLVELPEQFSELNRDSIEVSVYNGISEIRSNADVIEGILEIELLDRLISGENTILSIVLK